MADRLMPLKDTTEKNDVNTHLTLHGTPHSDTDNTTDIDNTCSFPKCASPDRQEVPGPIFTSQKPENGPRGHFSSSEKHILA